MSTTVEKVQRAWAAAKALKEYEATNQLHHLYTNTSGVRGCPYPWQVEFHQKGGNNRQRAIIAGNRTGKTRTMAAEVACHLIGWYPPWWKGWRFKRKTRWLVSGQTNEETRNVCQKALFGDVVDDGQGKKLTGTGWVPSAMIGGFNFRQCGVANVLDTVQVQHDDGGWSEVMFKSYEQGPLKFQGFEVEGVWFDEEPLEFQIFSEALTRIASTAGIFFFSRTPLLGMTKIVEHFIGGKVPGVDFSTATWEDAPHLDDEIKVQMTASYLEHERDARTKGVPMLGTGAVYPVPDELLLVAPFEIPDYYRQISGIDFGIDHPGAWAKLAHDPDADIIYLTDCYRERGWTAVQHSARIVAAGKWVPVSWPHDGMIRDKGGGVALKDQYQQHGCNMLGVSACYDDSKLGGQSREPATLDLFERMQTGRFKVFNTPACQAFLEEKRMLHRNDGKINAINDDIESAVRYAAMMLRYAVSKPEANWRRRRAPADSTSYDPLAKFSASGSR